RLMLQDSIADVFLARFLPLVASIRVGNPLDPDTEMGPLTSAVHRDRVFDYTEIARAQGASILAGGAAPTDSSLADGFYVMPTVVEARTDRDRIAQEEVFGPFVTVLRFKTEAEAV